MYKRANDLTSKTNEQYNISHDVGKQYIESQIAENSEDFSHEVNLINPMSKLYIKLVLNNMKTILRTIV